MGMFFILLFSGCSPHSLEDYYNEGQALTKKLIEELKPIQNREELEEALPKLKRQFEDLAALMIETRIFQLNHPEEEAPEYAVSLDDELMEEMKRIYELEKGRELMEKAQREAFLRLDSFTRSKQRHRQAG